MEMHGLWQLLQHHIRHRVFASEEVASRDHHERADVGKLSRRAASSRVEAAHESLLRHGVHHAAQDA